MGVPQGFWFSGAGGTGNYFQGFGEHAHRFGDLGSLEQSKKKKHS